MRMNHFVFTAVGLLALLSGACRPAAVKQEAGLPPVVVAEVLVADLPIFGEFVGQTEAPANVDVRARVEGFVEGIHFREGSRVKAGDLLFSLEREPIEQRLFRARATLAEAEAALAKARADIARYTPLVEKRAIPRQDLENAEAMERQGLAAVAAGKADVRKAEIDLSYTEVRAPVSGLIGEKQADVGSLVGGFNASLLATISPVDPIWFNANVSEVAYLEASRWFTQEEMDLWEKEGKGGRPVTLILADGEEHGEEGRFIFMDRAIDPKTGTLRLRAEFANPGNRLRPGMFGRVRVLLTEKPGAVVVPQRAVQEIQGTYSVFKLGEGDKAVFTRVKAGQRVGSLWVIDEGLAAGDRVVVEGVLKVRDGVVVAPAVTNISSAPVEALRRQVPGKQ
ncbi:MAG: Efflux pump periplasmic linker BepF [Verrucomicrobiota bacterium]